MPQYLKEANYSTHLVGKWHLGWQQAGSLPMERGYDSFFGFLQAQMKTFDHTMGLPILKGFKIAHLNIITNNII